MSCNRLPLHRVLKFCISSSCQFFGSSYLLIIFFFFFVRITKELTFELFNLCMCGEGGWSFSRMSITVRKITLLYSYVYLHFYIVFVLYMRFFNPSLHLVIQICKLLFFEFAVTITVITKMIVLSLLEIFHKPISKLYQNQYVFAGSSIILIVVY